MSTSSPPQSDPPLRVLALVAAESSKESAERADVVPIPTSSATEARLASAHAAILASLDVTVGGRALREALGTHYDAIVLALDTPEGSLGRELGHWHSWVSGAAAVVDVLAVDVPVVPTEWRTPTLSPGRLVLVAGPTALVPRQSGPWQEVSVIGPQSAGYWVGRDNHFAVLDGDGGSDSLRMPAVPHAIARWLGLPPLPFSDDIWLGFDRPQPTEEGPGTSAPPDRGPSTEPHTSSPRPLDRPGPHWWSPDRPDDRPGLRPVSPPRPFERPGPDWSSPPRPFDRRGSEPSPAPAPSEWEPPAEWEPPSVDGSPTVGAPPAYVAQHMMAETVLALAPRTEATVTVTVSGSELIPDSLSVGTAEFKADPSRVLTVFARTKGPIEVVDQWRHELPVQAAGVSDQCNFVVRAVAPGVGSVVVSAFQGSDDLASVELPITVRADAPDADHQPSQTGEAEVTASGPARLRNQLRVYKDGPDGYTCELTMPSVGLELRRQIRPQGGTPERLKAILESVGRLSVLSLSHGPALDDHLLGLGRRIQEWFLPPEFVRHLWEQRSQVDRLEVLSDEPHLPWELCAVSSPSGDIAEARPFLGERGVTRRWPNVVGVRLLGVRRDRRFLIAPTYPGMPDRFLPRGASEAELIETRFGAKRVPADLASVSELIRSGDYDLLHFVGHGWSSFGPIDASRLILDDSEFLDEQTPTGFTSQMVRKSDRHPVVFLNGCETGRLSTCIGGFAVAFMEAGAGLFIGTQWEVEDGPAREFAEALYGCLFDQMLTLSEAMATVRARRGPVWTATPLAYVAYGDPDARVVTAEAAGRLPLAWDR